MKLAILFFGLLFMVFISKAESSLMDKWPELKEFHGVMAGTFHPSEDGNLEPIKKRVGEFVLKAHKLATSKIPAEFNNDKVKMAVASLDKGALELRTMISKNATNDEIKTKLSSLHDNFHEIVGLCSKDHKE